ncbi:hypothetical protein ACFLYH_00330 [Candidatus Dependentiae bacterium]
MASSINKLKTINDKVQETNSGKLLFLSGFDFVEECLSNSSLKPIHHSIMIEADDDKNNFVELERDVLEELDSIHNEIKSYSKENGIKMKSDFESYGNEDPCKCIYSSWDVAKNKYFSLKIRRSI